MATKLDQVGTLHEHTSCSMVGPDSKEVFKARPNHELPYSCPKLLKKHLINVPSNYKICSCVPTCVWCLPCCFITVLSLSLFYGDGGQRGVRRMQVKKGHSLSGVFFSGIICCRVWEKRVDEDLWTSAQDRKMGTSPTKYV